MAVFKAVRAGTLIRPGVCEACGLERFTEAAHADYARPLDVRWLCRSCHRTEDGATPKGGADAARRKLNAATTQTA